MTDLAVQIHCLRHACAVDFAGTLRAIRELGIDCLEMCSFPGCAGNPWGDFGELGKLPGEAVRAKLDAAGLRTIACHFPYGEFSDGNLAAAVRWAQVLGSSNMVVPGVPLPAQRSVGEWRRIARELNAMGKRVKDAGMALVYHTQVEAWEVVEGVNAITVLRDILDPAFCRLEVDPSGAVLSGADWVALMQSLGNAVFALHLRDAAISQCIGGAYLPSLALGDGEMGWREALPALEAMNLDYWVLEMETLDPAQALPALEASLGFLDRAAIVAGE